MIGATRRIDDGSELRPAGVLAQRLAESFALRSVDVDVALVVLACELDLEFGKLVGTNHELGILAALFPHVEDRLAGLDAIGSDAPAIRCGLVRRTTEGTLVATRRFRAAVLGRGPLSTLPEFAATITHAPPLVTWAIEPAGLVKAMRTASTGVCVVKGAPGVGKTSWARHAALAATGSPTLLSIDAARAVRSGPAVALEIRELLEDSALVRCPVVIDDAGELFAGESKFSLLVEQIIATTPLMLFIVMGEDDTLHERLASKALGHVRIPVPPPAIRKELWRAAKVDDQTSRTLGESISLTPRQIANASALIRAGADAAVAAFEQIPKAYDLTLPDRSEAKLDKLVLPDQVRTELLELVRAIQIRGTLGGEFATARGRAISALFDGDSGTGKTFACEVIAAQVGLPLMRVNVSSLVDKYIGETEKNLTRVFAQAKARGGILFFDEADALFGTRTDVSKAQDRYANLETNLLLQLMESFDGVVLLTTNLKQNIDPAFMRRIMFNIYFEPPEAGERERIWRLFVPDESVELRRLARSFELTGGAIRAAAMRATYRAAGENRDVTTDDLAECAQIVIQSMGRVATW
ncbi:MAG TPA: ATP-binding protein [Kofleriaceae bacterium]